MQQVGLNCIKLKFHGSSSSRIILVTSSRKCLNVLARMFATSRACRARGLRRTTPTHGQTGSTTPQQTNQVSAWQAQRVSRRIRPGKLSATDQPTMGNSALHPFGVDSRVPALLAGIKAGMSPLPGGRSHCVMQYGT